MSAPLVLAVVLAVAIPLGLRAAYRLDDAFVTRWAHDRGLELTPATRPLVERYLRRARVLRAWGGVAGALVPSLIALAADGRIVVLGFGTDGNSAPLAFGAIFVGFLLGALVAELSSVRLVPDARRKADLTRRELESYLPRRLVIAQRAAAVGAALGTAAVAVVLAPPSLSHPGVPSLALAAAAILAFGAGLEAIERWLVRRPQPFMSAPLTAADDAIRAQSVQTIAGAGLAFLLLACSGVALALQASDLAVLHWAMGVAALACLLLSLLVCRGIGDGSWQVRRPARTSGAASA